MAAISKISIGSTQYDLKAKYDINGNEIVNKYATKDEVSSIPKFSISVVDELPDSNISSTTVYLLRTSETEVSNLYTEYIFVNNLWEKLGQQTVAEIKNIMFEEVTA